jgi:hypothetical protein
MHLVGDAVAGDKVTFDSNSNFKVLPPLSLTAIASAQPADIADVDDHVDAAFASFALELEDRHFEESLVVGRVLEFQKEPRGLLERVRTGWNGSEFGADAQMPGSATKGFTDLITLSDETVADEIAIINVKIQ